MCTTLLFITNNNDTHFSDQTRLRYIHIYGGRVIIRRDSEPVGIVVVLMTVWLHFARDCKALWTWTSILLLVLLPDFRHRSFKNNCVFCSAQYRMSCHYFIFSLSSSSLHILFYVRYCIKAYRRRFSYAWGKEFTTAPARHLHRSVFKIFKDHKP